MKAFEITLTSEVILERRYLGDCPPPRKIIVLSCNNCGIFADGQKVRDIFFNGLQLRLYVLGSYHQFEQEGRLIHFGYYRIFEDNENNLGLSFEDLYNMLKIF